MSIKFRRDGAVFPTEVKNGELIIYMGPLTIRNKFKFLVDDFEYDNTDFPMSNIMCYLRNDDVTVIMRYDGTVTKFNNDMVVIGFSKFDKAEIYKHTLYFPVGCVGTLGVKWERKGITNHNKCTIYTIPDSGVYFLECIGDPEAIVWYPKDNPDFTADVMKGTRLFPRLIKTATNMYEDDTGRYTVIGTPIKITGSVNM